jgi:hypothetical protein
MKQQGRIGMTHGIAPRVQIGTAPGLDLLGLPNLNAKANVMREGPFDGAVLGEYYFVPINSVLRRYSDVLGLGEEGQSLGDQELYTAQLSFLSLGAMGSLQVAKPWSLHVGVTYGRVSGKGQFNFADLPSIVIPGVLNEDLGGEAQLVTGIALETAQLRLATDIRFNRRDSLVLQYRGTFHARARAGAAFGEENLFANPDNPLEGENIELIVAYGGFVPLSFQYTASIAWQFSWKRVDARVGFGISQPLPWLWIAQPFELSYRFGGKTRRTEAGIRQGFRDNRRDLRDGSDSERGAMPGLPLPPGATPEGPPALPVPPPPPPQVPPVLEEAPPAPTEQAPPPDVP